MTAGMKMYLVAITSPRHSPHRASRDSLFFLEVVNSEIDRQKQQEYAQRFLDDAAAYVHHVRRDRHYGGCQKPG